MLSEWAWTWKMSHFGLNCLAFSFFRPKSRFSFPFSFSFCMWVSQSNSKAIVTTWWHPWWFFKLPKTSIIHANFSLRQMNNRNTRIFFSSCTTWAWQRVWKCHQWLIAHHGVCFPVRLSFHLICSSYHYSSSYPAYFIHSTLVHGQLKTI